jgi:pilus assembly protein Flp/PilA
MQTDAIPHGSKVYVVLLANSKRKKTMKNLLKKLSRDERGVSALEYAILAAVVIGVVVAAIEGFGGKIETAFDKVGTQLNSAIDNTN